MQDATGDGNLSTSDGILVFGGSTSGLTVGAAVLVNGTVTEFGSGDNLTVTELTQPAVTPAGPATPIAATILGQGGRTQPSVVIEDDANGDLNAPGEGGNVFDIGQDGIDFYESLEAHARSGQQRCRRQRYLLIRRDHVARRWRRERDRAANAARGVTGWRRPTRTRSGSPSTTRSSATRSTPRPAKAMPRHERRCGLIMFAGRRAARLQLRELQDPGDDAAVIVEKLDPARGRCGRRTRATWTVATFNVENLDGGQRPVEVDELADMIVHNLRAPRSSRSRRSRTTAARRTTASSTATATWNKPSPRRCGRRPVLRCSARSTPSTTKDGGAPGCEHRCGLLYRTDLEDLRFVDRPGGTPTNNTSVVGPENDPQLTFSPGRLGTD